VPVSATPFKTVVCKGPIGPSRPENLAWRGPGGPYKAEPRDFFKSFPHESRGWVWRKAGKNQDI
jgi:hypothetical protein